MFTIIINNELLPNKLNQSTLLLWRLYSYGAWSQAQVTVLYINGDIAIYMSHSTVFPVLLLSSWIYTCSVYSYNIIYQLLSVTPAKIQTMIIIILLSLESSQCNVSTGHYIWVHIALCCDELWPLIAPLQLVNSTGRVLLLEEHEMAKQVWAGQGYIPEWGWDGDGYTSIQMGIIFIAQGDVCSL